MRSIGMVRRVDQLGRAVIPVETLRLLHINPGDDAVEIFIDTDNKTMALRRYVGHACFFCGNSERLRDFQQRLVCPQCLGDLYEEFCGSDVKKEVAVTAAGPAQRYSTVTLVNMVGGFLNDHPGAKQLDIAEALGISQGRVSQIMKIIREARREDTDGSSRYRGTQ